MQNISRRKALQLVTGASVLAPTVLLPSSCMNANAILTAINNITNDAEQVLINLQGSVCTVAQTTACISESGYTIVMAWVTALQSANTQALSIDAGASTLTSAQIADITLLYSKVVLQNIPLPTSVATWVTIAQEAVQALLSLLNTAQVAANVATSHALPLTISWGHLESARRKNTALKTHIEQTKTVWAAKHNKA